MDNVQNNSAEVEAKDRKKPGPVPQGGGRYNVILPPELADWAKHRKGGLSESIRQALGQLKAEEDAKNGTDPLN